jgi:hypothetical protein
MSEEVTKAFLLRLWELQSEARLSDKALADLIGCSPSYITHMRAGRKGKRIGLNIAMGAASVFPELRSFFLPPDVLMRNTVVPQGNETTESES